MLIPYEQNYYMPAEWEQHAATWFAWPTNCDDWPGKFAAIPFVFAEIFRILVDSERVALLVQDAQQADSARTVLELNHVNMDQVDFYTVPTNRVWLRDSGPTILKQRDNSGANYLLLDWNFNAWAKYSDYELDNQVAQQIGTLLQANVVQPHFKKNGKTIPITLEGGAIDVNGVGTLLTTEECLLSSVQARNPELTQADIEQVFHDYLAVTTTVWLQQGIVGDDTHGHIDDMCRFVNTDTVVMVVETDSRDENYAALRKNLQRLKQASDQHGKPFNIAELPMPQRRFFSGTRLPMSYANFFIANSCVLVPVFNDVNDRCALDLLAHVFPTRQIVPIAAVDLIWGLGAIHCLCQQQPLLSASS